MKLLTNTIIIKLYKESKIFGSIVFEETLVIEIFSILKKKLRLIFRRIDLQLELYSLFQFQGYTYRRFLSFNQYRYSITIVLISICITLSIMDLKHRQ